MRIALTALLGIVLTLGGASALGQELSVENKERSQERNRASGTFHNVQEKFGHLIVNDQSYFIGSTVWVDGTKYRSDNLESTLDAGETVVLELSGERRDGYPVVDKIKTTP